jgi:hypothetical protein
MKKRVAEQRKHLRMIRTNLTRRQKKSYLPRGLWLKLDRQDGSGVERRPPRL